MPEVAIIDNDLLHSLIFKIEKMDAYVTEINKELKQKTKPYLSSQELMELTGFGSKWVIDNKEKIGFTTIGNQLRFKRKDVEEFMDLNYFKIQRKKNKQS